MLITPRVVLFQIMASSKAQTGPEKSKGSHTGPEKSKGSHTGPEKSKGSHTGPEKSKGSHTAPEKSKGSHTAPASSDKVYHLCESCIEDGIEKEAKHYCQDCGQKICDDCKDFHRKLAGTRDHTISPVNVDLATVSGNLGQMNISSHDAATKTVLLGRNVQLRSQANVKAGDDKTIPWISGCTVMANGDIVLCDFHNQKIKLLNSSGNLTGNINLASGPCDVSSLDPTSVIVTLPGNKQLQVVQVYPQLKPGRVIQLDKWCWGVEVVKDELYVTCNNDPGEGEIRVLDLDGKVKRRLGVDQWSFMFISPYHITVNRSGEKIFISDWDTCIVTCMSVDGRVIYTYTDDNIRGLRGLLCDSEDNILVCGWWSHNVHVLTADGKRHCTLLTESDGLKWPHSIAYRDNDNTLLVGCYTSDHLLSFQLTK